MIRLRLIGFQVVLAAAFSVLIGINGCSKKPTESGWPDKPGPKVLTSFAPIQCFALNVAGGDATVMPLLTNQGPHGHVDPTAEHLKLASKADVLFINGLNLDEELVKKAKSASGKEDLKIVELAEAIDEKRLIKGESHHDDGKQHEDGHDHGVFDPHVWLSAVHARMMVVAIRDELKRIDPAHAAGYDSRAADYIGKLEKLERDGIALFKDKKEKKIISFHDSLRYFGECYGITIADHIQIEPGVEPTAEEMKKIIKLCKEQNIRIIAVEPQFPRNTSAGTILAELKNAGIAAEFVEIDPLETAQPNELTADFYERKMRENLENLAKALR